MRDPMIYCLRKLDHASAVSDSGVTAIVSDALTELEAAYNRPTDRVLALERVLHRYNGLHTRQRGTPFHRFLIATIDHRQNSIAAARRGSKKRFS